MSLFIPQTTQSQVFSINVEKSRRAKSNAVSSLARLPSIQEMQIDCWFRTDSLAPHVHWATTSSLPCFCLVGIVSKAFLETASEAHD